MPRLRNLLEPCVIAAIVLLAVLDGSVLFSLLKAEDALSTAEFMISAGEPDMAVPAQSETARAATAAETNADDALPGRFVPTQGRQHTGAYPLRSHVPFCEGGKVSANCYASNPPTSGLHLPVQRNVRLSSSTVIDVPPNRGIYDDPIPREAIPHIEEHAGVYVGYRCSDGCGDAVDNVRSVVAQEISLGARVVMSPDPDLPEGTISVVSWTRIETFAPGDYSDELLRAFIKAHNCRFDPEAFCKQLQIN